MANSAYQESNNVNSKRPKSFDKETCSDRISQLPDVLIQHILSFLPTKEAMATSILSKRWLWVWTSVPVLHLEDSLLCCTYKNLQIGFMQFVNKVFIFNNVTCLDKFYLETIGFYPPSVVKGWLWAALARDVKELVISIPEKEIYPLLKLPCILFTAKKLNILKLKHGVELEVPGIVSLPSLKVLHLHLTKYTNDESVSRLFSGCPVLEELLVNGFAGYNALNLNIFIPTLKRLSLSLWIYTKNSRFNLKLNAPILEYLNIQERLAPVHIVNVLSLVEAKLTVPLLEETDIPLLKALYNAKSLSIQWDWDCTFQACNGSKMYPLFLNLVRLELHVGHGGWNLLSRFLEKSHNLQVLVLAKNANCRGVGAECQWKPPKLIPICLLSSLKMVHFKGFEGLKYQMRLVQYILKNARVLKMMDICTNEISNLGGDSKFDMLKKLLMFPRGSRACQLQFN